MSRKPLPEPMDDNLVLQLWKLKERRLLKDFVGELNSWELGKRSHDTLRKQDYHKKFSRSAVQSWFLQRRKPSIRDAEILRRKIIWIRHAHPTRARGLKGQPTAR